jgi:hypothetical protein
MAKTKDSYYCFLDSDEYYLDKALGSEILCHRLLDRDGYCHYDTWFIMLFLTVMDITKFYSYDQRFFVIGF